MGDIKLMQGKLEQQILHTEFENGVQGLKEVGMVRQLDSYMEFYVENYCVGLPKTS